MNAASLIAIVTFAACALSLVACGDDDTNKQHATATTRPTPQATAQDTTVPASPAAYRGGITSVDAALAALDDHDIEGLVSQMRYAQLACEARPEPLSMPPPCDGDAEGSMVDVFPTASCEGAYQRPAVAEQSLRSFLNARPDSHLFGVYRIAGSKAEQSMFVHAAPAYEVVFAAPSASGQEVAWAVLLDDAGIVGLAGGCGDAADKYVSFWELGDPITGP